MHAGPFVVTAVVLLATACGAKGSNVTAPKPVSLAAFYAEYQADGLGSGQSDAAMTSTIKALCDTGGARYLFPASQQVVDANSLAIKYFCPDRAAEIKASFTDGYAPGVTPLP